MLAGVSGSWLPAGVKERYAIHALPLLLLALVLWIERGMPGPRWVVAVPLALVAALPFGTIFASASFPSNGIDLYAFQRLDVHVGHVRELAIAGALVAAALFLLRRRELVRAARRLPRARLGGGAGDRAQPLARRAAARRPGRRLAPGSTRAVGQAAPTSRS